MPMGAMAISAMVVIAMVVIATGLAGVDVARARIGPGILAHQLLGRGLDDAGRLAVLIEDDERQRAMMMMVITGITGIAAIPIAIVAMVAMLVTASGRGSVDVHIGCLGRRCGREQLVEVADCARRRRPKLAAEQRDLAEHLVHVRVHRRVLPLIMVVIMR